MQRINYFFEDTPEQPALTNIKVSDWIQSIIDSYESEIEEINYIYCSDNYLLKVNQKYLDHDYYTDTITFDNREDRNEPIEADIFISLDRVQDNATEMNVSFKDELHRVMIHGIHHLLGQGDKTDTEKAEMRKREEASLSLRQF